MPPRLRILLLSRSFNGLTQRLLLALEQDGHEVSIEFDIADSVTEEAVALFAPDVIVAPFMQRAIAEAVWRKTPCLIVHPGIVGDRGPSALDWAISEGVREWGVTVLQAEAELDAGPVWATRCFALRSATKSSLYRNEVTEGAVDAVREALRKLTQNAAPARPAASTVRTRPFMRQEQRRIDWAHDTTATVLRKLQAADGVPGVLDALFDTPSHLYDARAASGQDLLQLANATTAVAGNAVAGGAMAGRVLARRHGAVLRATADGAVWLGHCRRAGDAEAIKLPVALAFAEQVSALPVLPGDAEIRYEEHGEHGEIGVLHFAFYNGAMSTAQCERLLAAYRAALERPARVLVLAGGPDFFSNGIHLNVIEAAASPADESWRNINAMDDVCEAILTSTDRRVVAALQGNAGAGGAFLALTADAVWARDGVLLNPHYKNMGNLYGSEYWTYTLPRRVKHGEPRAVMQNRLPIDASQAAALGLVDEVLVAEREAFLPAVIARATALAATADFPDQLVAKAQRRAQDEAAKPLARYRDEELAMMRRNFYGFDSSYHVARSYFVRKTAPSWTPRHLARHRDRSVNAATAASLTAPVTEPPATSLTPPPPTT
jgi:putative two-component system protein, hydrogenase maturation factor HypX/HoxX